MNCDWRQPTRWGWGLILLVALATLSGCQLWRPLAPTPVPELPLLRLPPASLGTHLSLHQQLSVQHAGQNRQLEVLLEIEPQQLQLAAMSLGLQVLHLQFDGQTLTQQRHPLLPAQVDSARILRDLQLAYWPAAPLQAALPAGWRLVELPGQRQLWWQQQRVMQLDYSQAERWQGQIRLENLSQQYRLQIESRAL